VDTSNDAEQLYNAYYMQVYSFLMASSANRDLAMELTQKTFFKAVTAAKPFDGRNQASELTWLCAIAKNLLTDERRRQSRIQPLAVAEAAETNLEHTLADEDTAFRVHQALHDLPEPYKEVFQLRVFGELAFQKIGLLFGKTENWARVTHHRARLKLQERMGEQE